MKILPNDNNMGQQDFFFKKMFFNVKALMPHSPFLYNYKEKDYKNLYNISVIKSLKSDFLSVGIIMSEQDLYNFRFKAL